MPHVLVAGALHPAGLELLRAEPGYTFDYVEAVSEASYAPMIGAADGIVIRTQPLSAATVAKGERLAIVSRHGVGYDSVDLPALNARGIALAVVGDVNSVSVAEHSMMMILAVAKRVLRADRAVRAPGGWDWRNRLEAGEVLGKTLLILGYGRIGQALGRMAAGFGMRIEAHDPWLEARGWPAETPAVPAGELDAALARADFVSVNLPRSDRPAIGAREFGLMKPGVIVVNTARGGVIDEPALAGALASGRVAGAGLDVFEDEPPAPENPLLEFEQVLLSPHIAGLTAECAERMAVAAVQNVIDFFAGGIDPALVVNRDAALSPQRMA